jgi:hypothetical protein
MEVVISVWEVKAAHGTHPFAIHPLVVDWGYLFKKKHKIGLVERPKW